MVTGLVRRARVVATTAGPYAKYGGLLLHACAEAGTDYADLTGETLFVRRSVETCHERAGETGARLVHSCGFDSVPSDLGVGLSAAARRGGRRPLVSAVLHVRSARGGDQRRHDRLTPRSDRPGSGGSSRSARCWRTRRR